VLKEGDGLADTVRVLDTVLHTVGLVVAEEEEDREGESVPVMEELPLPQELMLAELLCDGDSVVDRVWVSDTLPQEEGLPDTEAEALNVPETVLHTVGLVETEEEEDREGEIVLVMEELPLPQELTLEELLWDGVSVVDRVLVTDTLPEGVWLPDTEAVELRVPLNVGLCVTLPVLQLEAETV
jgi:hypothetical protein